MNDSIQAVGRRDQGRSGGRKRQCIHRRQWRDNSGFMYVALKPLNERKISATDDHQSSAAQVNRLPVASAFLQAAQDLRIGGRGSNALYQYTIQSDNVADLTHVGTDPARRDEEASRLAGCEHRPAERRAG